MMEGILSTDSENTDDDNQFVQQPQIKTSDMIFCFMKTIIPSNLYLIIV